MKFKWSEPYLIPIYFWIIFMLAKYTNGNIFVLVGIQLFILIVAYIDLLIQKRKWNKEMEKIEEEYNKARQELLDELDKLGKETNCEDKEEK